MAKIGVQHNCPAGIAGHGLAQANQVTVEHLHRELYHLVAELKAMISEVDRRLDGRISEVGAEVDRAWAQIEES